MAARKHRVRAGYVLLTITAGMVTFLGFAGLVLDLSYMEYYRRRVQIAADAGSLGAARELQANGSQNVVDAATQDITTNGFTNGSSGATVTVTYPPATGPFAGNARYVEVVVGRQMPTFFMKMLKVDSMTVKARSVGGMAPSSYCVMALDPLLAGALEVKGNTTVNIPSCGVMVDSNSPQAMTVGNSACITANQIDIVGNYTSGGCAPTPTPTTGTDIVYDPLATLAAPSFSGCNHNNFSVNSTATLNPGVYCGGIKIAGNNSTITFNPGTYILDGGGFTATGGNILRGTGVTFYNTATGTQVFDDIRISGGVQANFSAPTSGPMEGVLFFQDRNIPTTSSNGNSITGNSGSTFDGVFYFPKGKVTYTGNSSANGYTNIVANTITFTGSSTVRNDYSSLSSGAPIKTGALIE